MSIFKKVFGDADQKYVKSVQPVVDKINGLEAQFGSFSIEELMGKTQEFKEMLQNGRALEDFLPEAFALVREAAKRTLSQRHFDAQLIGGQALHQGKITEMKTGEGKTLAATLPVYLNALSGEGVHVITVNDYLARRDTVWMGQIYHALGLSAACIVHDAAFIYDPQYSQEKEESDEERDKERDKVGSFKIIESYLRPVSRREAYQADVTYGTNHEFGFDYLRDNMVYDSKSRAQRGLHYAIIDEVDSVLIDEARTPLIISAPDVEATNMYDEFARIIPRLQGGENEGEGDYDIDEKLKAVTLTEAGIDKIEKILNVDNIYQDKGIRYLHHLEQALRAESMFKKDKDYVVKDGEVIIVDQFTGRLMPGRRWSGGLHQAVEAKERVAVNPESITLATITFQNYFRMYKKLAGMTGTATTSAEEFYKVYGLDVVVVPTNKPMVRDDMSDQVYKSQDGKFRAVVREVKGCHQKGQPVLVGTVSINTNEYLGKLLEKEGVPHQILNAKHHEREGEIIAQAGRLGAVTIATNMAGRGVDIILGGNPPDSGEAEKVKELGGLHVIGTERHEARRIDNQLRGRAGRQGDPGSSRFFISLEDDLMRIFGGDRIKGVMERLKISEDEPIQAKIISGAIESAQSKIEANHFDMRQHILEYDDVMNKHRETFYRKRYDILERARVEDPKSEAGLRAYFLELIKKMGASEQDYINKEKELGDKDMRDLEKIVALRVLDTLWISHLENMEYLRDSVKLRAYGQQDPLVEYKNEGHKMFQKLLAEAETSIVQTIFKAKLVRQDPTPQETQTNISSSGSQPVQKHAVNKPGRNDPCSCGSGKKYKKCCGK